MSTTVQCVIGQFDFVEQNWLGGPMRSQRRTVRMQIHSLGALRFGSAGRHPLRAREFVATITAWNHFEQHTIVGVVLKAR